MENYVIEKDEFIIIFSFNSDSLNIYIKHKIKKIQFETSRLKFEDEEDILIKYISNFKDLINKIQQNDIKVEIEKHLSNVVKYVKYIKLNLKINEKDILLSKDIYSLNVEYYLTEGPNYQRVNSIPFSSCIKKESFNCEDIFELIDNQKLLDIYKLDDIKYLDSKKGVFKPITNNKISINDEKIILEFHISEKKNDVLYELKKTKENINDEIINLKYKLNKLSDSSRQYDLIYLYASPIISDDNFNESDAPISYMKEIRIITDLMKNKNKKLNCKFECINEEALIDNLFNNKTKILHISAHGIYDGSNYSLVVENLKKYGQRKMININSLRTIFESIKKNISEIDLAFISTCYSEDLGKLFLEKGAKNSIYIHQKTEVIDDISVEFTRYFYQNLLDGETIEKSYKNAINKLKLDTKISNLNFNSCCCNHYHKPDCEFNENNRKERFHEKIHAQKSDNCKCNFKEYGQHNYHDKNCKYYDILKKGLIDKKKLIHINEKDNINIICCCDEKEEIIHNEILKIIYKAKDNNNDYANIKPFKLNDNGKLFIKSKIKFHYDRNKYGYILGRKNIIGHIFNNIKNNENNFVIFLGEKYLEKMEFSESLCVYLYERDIIINYEIFRIISEFDFIHLKHKIFEINEIIKNEKSMKKYIIIIKFDNNDNTSISYKYLIEICNMFYPSKENKLYFIFIFDIEEKEKINNSEKIELFINDIKKYINEQIILEINKNIFYSGMVESFCKNLLDYFIDDPEKINGKEKFELVYNKSQKKPKKIKLISDLLLKGENVKNILEMNEDKLTIIELDKEKLSFPLYYLLLNMPSGLPDCFLELIFNNYDKIDDDKNLITKSRKNNWNLIIKDKFFEENFKENKYMEKCYIYIFECLKLYCRLLNFFIQKNKEKINYRNGNIHYIFNSYNNRYIWKSKIYNSIGKILGNKIFHRDFMIKNHIENIMNLVSFVIDKIELFKKLNDIEYQIDDYLEDILLLFPSFFFLDKKILN